MPTMAPNLVTHPNPCPNPNIPPLRLEIEDIPIAKSHPQFSHAVAAVTAYWRQATNMALSDQQEYRDLVASSAFIVPKSAEGIPSQHKLYKAIKNNSTWARHVMLNAIYGKVKSLAEHVKTAHGSDVMENFFNEYCKHHPWQRGLKKRQRESIAQGQPPSKKHAEAPASSNSAANSSGKVAIKSEFPESKSQALGKLAKVDQKPMVAPVSNENKLALHPRSDSPLFTRGIQTPSQKAAETDKMDEILRELVLIRENQAKQDEKMDEILREQGHIREHLFKETDKVGKAMARAEGSNAELTSRFKVVEKNVQLLLKKNP
ncbi:uncharacterized protein Triagg1_8934 [Trichoderma aggressivum f. europaeum]|uniref:No apical meristem-associated C-terminal domain-containing protein n=1 Tax=Trichoderma aggressivum f. europaeum TaxID=173218 RepID=A0AAE1J2X2_9HYPO|nr:hypothetical protein Triagg1_8934 [Trichoderma aggressivum f. europaeum]